MCVHRGQNRVLDFLKQELQVLMSYPMWVLRTELGFFERITNTLNLPSQPLKPPLD